MKSNTDVQIFDSNEARVQLTLSIGNETETQPFKICVIMGADFMWEEAIEEETAKKLLNVNAPAIDFTKSEN